MFTIILFFIAIAGIGAGVWVIYEAVKHSQEIGAGGVAGALGVAVLPLLVGVVALSGATVVFAIEEARDSIVDALRGR